MALGFFFVVLLVAHYSLSDSYRQIGPNTQKLQKTYGENGVLADPTVHCGIESMLLDIRTQRPFSGRVFVKGFSRQSECQFLGNGTITAIKFGVPFERCGLRRSREPSGVSVAAVVVVSFHPLLVTKLDRAFHLNCFYSGESHKTVAQQLEVGQLSTSASIRSQQHPMPNCRYDILWMNANGQPIRFVKIGDTVYHRWSCQPETPSYCMRVHSCTVSDGQGGEPVEVLDNRGCALDGLLLRDLDYLGDLSAGQSVSVFKFADKPTLHFNCQIELTQHDINRNCSENRLKCDTEEKVAKTQNDLNENGKAGDTNWGDEENYGANRWPTEQQPFTTRWNFASGLFVQGIVTEKALHAAQFRLAPNKTNGWKNEAARGQTQVKPSRQSREFGHTQRQGETAAYDDEGEEEQEEGQHTLLDALRSRRELGYRRVADFDLPERALVVIDEDDHSMAQQQSLRWHPSDALGTKRDEQCNSQSEHQTFSWHFLLGTVFLLLSLLTILLWTNLLSQNWRRKMKYIVNGRRERDKAAEKEKAQSDRRRGEQKEKPKATAKGSAIRF